MIRLIFLRIVIVPTLALIFGAASPSLLADRKADLSRFVVVGDSLAAGFQNFSLLSSQQVNGPASLIAAQARIPLHLPLVPYPGVPNVLQLVTPGPPPVVLPVPGLPPSPPRVNVFLQATNLAVPGQTVAEAILKRPSPVVVTGVDALTNIVLGFPSPIAVPGTPRSQLESALALSPTFVLLWIGNNDALFAALTGDLNLLTPTGTFTASYNELSRTLAATTSVMVMVNIPDVTSIPYFTSLEKLSEQAGVPPAALGAWLGMQSGDSIRPGAMPVVQAILRGQIAGPLPLFCASTVPGLPIAQVPCVLRASEVAIIRGSIQSYNQVIAARARELGAALVDLQTLVSDLAARGYSVGGRELTVDFLGGLFSLDGVHPTNTGYAIIANEILEQMKRQLGINITRVNVTQIAKVDPLVPSQ